MSALLKRLRYLRNAEAACALALPLGFVLAWQKPAAGVAWELRLPALALVSYLLLQGAFYWHLKQRAVATHTGLPAFFRPLYRALKWSNVALIGLVLLVLALGAARGAALPDLAWSAGLLGFVLLEHVNYYAYQLMYDTGGALRSLRQNGRLRAAALGVDLARAPQA